MVTVTVPASNQDRADSSEDDDASAKALDENNAVFSKMTRTIEGQSIPGLLLSYVFLKQELASERVRRSVGFAQSLRCA
jgi:hypothetical protein